MIGIGHNPGIDGKACNVEAQSKAALSRAVASVERTEMLQRKRAKVGRAQEGVEG